MPEEIEVETKELQEAIEELHQEKSEREAEEKKGGWTKYIGLTTAILAVFAAIGALRAGTLVNEALINQVKASDTWNQYEADRQKDHLYTIMSNTIVDANRGIFATPASAKGAANSKNTGTTVKAKSPGDRLKEYSAEIKKEREKEEKLSESAKDLEKESKDEVSKHERFAISVAMIQVAIALGAVSALTRVKSVWALSMALGLIGAALFCYGFMH